MRYVLALARSKTLSAAAENLGVNYTTVARRIRRLEETTGNILFEEGKNGYIPTDVTADMLSNLEHLEAEFATIEGLMSSLTPDVGGVLTVTFPTSVGKYLILPHLRAFQKQYPDIKLRLVASSGFSNLALREADIALRVSSGLPDEHLVGQRIAEIKNAVYCSHDYAARLRDKSHGLELLFLPDMAEELKQSLTQDLLQRITSVTEVNGFKLLLDSIEAGLGIGVLPRYIGENNPALQPLPVRKEPETRYHLWILSHPNYRSSLRIKAFKTFIADRLRANKGLTGT